jgi:hypothetical protein
MMRGQNTISDGQQLSEEQLLSDNPNFGQRQLRKANTDAVLGLNCSSVA